MFDNFISLGWFCGMTASLAKCGFRNGSYPFDWYFSDFKSILHFIDTDFSDFMVRKNLRKVTDNPFTFEDIKYNLRFNHDIKADFDQEYPDIYEKYLRRINRFRSAVQNPSCFLRALKDEDELQYITDNQDDIRRIIRKSNSSNEIVFLIPQWIKTKENLSFPSFILNIEAYRGDRKSLRSMLDKNNDVIEFLQSNITVPDIASNLAWDRESELKPNKLNSRYNIAMKLLNNDLNLSLIPQNIVIYGAGNIGKAFFNKCKNICTIECFIDQNSNKDRYKGIPVLSLNRINKISCENYVITPVYDFDNIKNWFSKNRPNANLISINSLFAAISP